MAFCVESVTDYMPGNHKLASYVCESVLKVPRPANNVIHDDFSVSVIIDWDTVGTGELLLSAV